MAISPAKAIPIAIPVYGTFSGVVTSSANAGDGHYYYAAGTPVTGMYSYTPSLLNGGATGFADPTAYYQININGLAFSWYGDNLNFSVDANGEPVLGSGVAAWDLFLGPNGPSDVGMTASGIYFISAQVTYSTPSTTPPTVPDAASTASLTGLAMLTLAVFRRLNSRFRHGQTVAR